MTGQQPVASRTTLHAMIDPKDGMEDARFHNNKNDNINNTNNTNATTTVTDKSFDMLTEGTVSTSKTADNGIATTRQTQ
jgi:hypothetical protein